ncbi:MAG: discoidin domain-containing protein [Phycisphaerae bacterium]|nr:discoidin domain-containing protein [Phycisphaerae bacterium]
MCSRSFLALLMAALTLLSVGSAYGRFDPAKDPALLGWWSFDEKSGTVAVDGSANGNNGTLNGGATRVPGIYGTALHFDGQSAYVGTGKSLLNGLAGFTMAGWISASSTGVYASLFGQNDLVELGFTTESGGQLGTWMLGNNWAFLGANYGFPYPSWHHVALAGDRTKITLYIDGQEMASDKGGMSSGTSSFFFNIGGNVFNATGDWFRGEIDDVWLFSRALTEAEIRALMKGPGGPGLATAPRPAAEAADVTRDVVLGWTPGEFAATRDVYLGKTLADVNSASRAKPVGVLASQGQTATTYSPTALLDFGQTYYWRIDEVNQAPDNTIFTGTIWSFTVEPYSYPITAVMATASSAQNGMGPENTVNGSGLTGDRHGIDAMTMWMSKGTLPNWIQYQFDAVYKLDKLLVWNSNQAIEPFIGFGAKDVTVEYSVNGTAWTVLANVPPFAQGTGSAAYAANTTVTFGGVSAKYVKLTINKTWGGLPSTGLAEVRFYSIPMQARAPQPTAAATGVAIDTTLTWRPGREAGSHKVYFGTDQAAVTNGTVAAKTVADHSSTPSSLNFGTTYYWKVDEVNTVTYPGDVWSFTTQEFAAVDDFESYNDTDNRIYDTSIDGMTDGNRGSVVGYLQAPFAEQTIIHGGKQSMPLEYNNVKTPYYSEASRTFEATQNWTTNGADTLSLYFRGRAVGFADNGNGTFTMSSSGTDVWNNGDQFRFAYKSLNGDGSIVARVDSIVNTNIWAKGGVMIRQSIDAGSTHAFMPITAGGSGAGNGASFQRRLTAAGASTNDDNAAPAVAAPYWVKVERKGNSFTGSISADGKTWKQLGAAQTITMTNPVLIGLALCSHDAALTTVAEISNVSTTGTVTGSWQDVAIGMAMPTNGAAPLYLTVQDKAGKTKTVVNPNPSASATAAWTQWRIPLSDLTGVSLTTVQKITLGVGDATSPKAGGAGMLFIDDIGYGHPVK